MACLFFDSVCPSILTAFLCPNVLTAFLCHPRFAVINSFLNLQNFKIQILNSKFKISKICKISLILLLFIVVQLLSCVLIFATPWTAAPQASLFFTILQSLLKFLSAESVMLSNHLILCCHFHLLPSILPSIRIFSNESALWIRWPKYWCFSFSISPSDEYSGLISFRMDWFDLLAVQGILKSLLQHHHSKV